MNRSQNGYDDDIDDIMASIMSDKNEPARRRQPATHKEPSIARRRLNEQPGIKSRQASHPTSANNPPKRQVQSARETRSHEQSTERTQLSTRSKAKILTLLTLILVIGTASLGFIYLREPVLSLLKPKAPFSPEISEKSQTPLYYPTKLPGSFKMETNSITQSDTGVVIYAITDDSGKKINVSIQKKPDNLNLEPLYLALSNVRDVDTKLGTIKVGQSNEGSSELEISNITVDSSWIILSSTKGTVTDEELITIINNLSKS